MHIISIILKILVLVIFILSLLFCSAEDAFFTLGSLVFFQYILTNIGLDEWGD